MTKIKTRAKVPKKQQHDEDASNVAAGSGSGEHQPEAALSVADADAASAAEPGAAAQSKAKTSPTRPRSVRAVATGTVIRPTLVAAASPMPAHLATGNLSNNPISRASNNGVATHGIAPLVCGTPMPTTAAAFGVMTQPPSIESELSLVRIIEEYGERTDLLRLVLAAKTEQDRARAEYERRLQEELRYETRRLDFEMMLHGNMFKQQEREHEKRQQQQMMPPPAIPAAIVHRPDMVLHSPIGPPPQQQQPMPAATPMHYGPPLPPHDPHVHARSYHHPDTPGGLDVHANQHPFAFFKTPLGGAPIHHPSAYSQQQQQSRVLPSGANDQQHPPTSSANLQLGIRERRPVPPAVSGLSVRIVDQTSMMDAAPRSAPVDGPALGKRRISHDEVIRALRRKVMSKSAALGQAASVGQKPVEPRRSSLAVITHADTEDEDATQKIDMGALSESSESESDESLLQTTADTRSAAQQQQQQQQRLPSISMMLDADSASSKPDSDPAADNSKTRSV
ncbi:hypothetical protein GGF40_002019 [Coemansia sp. RSA 1286]|nr:hypothetical protein GGF39_001710 [Coemansia sp. RSA 1721]KAJ2637921.1 hypothetical protein GGF40_002019 [Coemansia sp. RSA 1286]